MRHLFLVSFIGLSVSAFSQQQQQLANVFLSNNSNPVIQMAQTNLFNANDDNNVGNQMSQQGNFDNYKNDDLSDEGLSNVRQASSSGNAIDLNLSFKMPSRSSSSSSTSSKSKSQKHSFSKKLKKFERNFYGKMGAHKKSKHLVDVCFNWK
ncbi:MAG: hypothetical protein C0448_04815 [Sphingobacteriaceae bacterium]|nr:hypothetical protein [Sphingobacteriaceae bacterium]